MTAFLHGGMTINRCNLHGGSDKAGAGWLRYCSRVLLLLPFFYLFLLYHKPRNVLKSSIMTTLYYTDSSEPAIRPSPSSSSAPPLGAVAVDRAGGSSAEVNPAGRSPFAGIHCSDCTYATRDGP